MDFRIAGSDAGKATDREEYSIGQHNTGERGACAVLRAWVRQAADRGGQRCAGKTSNANGCALAPVI